MKICMLAYSFYHHDNRIMRYAEALAARGDQVDVISLLADGFAPVDTMNGVKVYRIQRRDKFERGKFAYLRRLTGFLLRSTWFLTRNHMEQPYDLIHVHSVPDFEVFAALFAKLRGARVILDIHDIVPEFYASKFGVSKNSLAFKALETIERLSIAFSDHVIISNHIWEKVLKSRSVSDGKCTTILNYPDSRMFNATLRTRKDDGKIIMIYPGSLNWHQGVDIAIKAFDLIREKAPEAEFHIYGVGTSLDQIIKLIDERSLKDRVLLKDGLTIDKIAKVMANADLGIVPKRNDPFGGDAFSTKIFEFMAVGVPVIAAKTRIDQYYFNDSLVKFFNAGDEQSLADAMLLMIQNESMRKKLAENALVYIAKQSWDVKRHDYLSLVDSLVLGKR